MGAQVDLWQGVPGWEQLPEWIAAIATVLAFGAAVVAGVFAGKAAKHTADQATSARDQVRFADEQTALAKQQLDLARAEAREAREVALVQQAQAERAEQRLEQSRLDALMPVVHAAATLVVLCYVGVSVLCCNVFRGELGCGCCWVRCCG